MARYNRFTNLSKEELSARGKERYNGMSDEEKRNLKEKFYDYDNQPNCSRLEREMGRGNTLLFLHTTTAGLKEMNHPMQIGVTVFEEKNGEYKQTDGLNLTIALPQDIEAKAVDAFQKGGFNAFEYNGLAFARYLQTKMPVSDAVSKLNGFLDAHKGQIVTFNRAFNVDALSHLSPNLGLRLGDIDLLSVVNEANEDSVLFSGKATIPNIAKELNVANPVTAYEKAEFLGYLMNYTAKTLEFDIASEKQNVRMERPKDEISEEDIRGIVGDVALPFGDVKTEKAETNRNDGMSVSDFGNLFSDVHGAKMDVVTAENAQKVGEVNIPHVEESAPFKEAVGNTDYLKEICASLKTIIRQNEMIMDSLAKNGKTIEEIQPKVEPTNSKPKAFEFDVPKTYRLNVPAEHFEAIIDNLVSKGTDFTFDDKKKQITTRDKHVPYYFESQKIPHTEISQKSKEEGR